MSLHGFSPYVVLPSGKTVAWSWMEVPGKSLVLDSTSDPLVRRGYRVTCMVAVYPCYVRANASWQRGLYHYSLGGPIHMDHPVTLVHTSNQQINDSILFSIFSSTFKNNYWQFILGCCEDTWREAKGQGYGILPPKEAAVGELVVVGTGSSTVHVFKNCHLSISLASEGQGWRRGQTTSGRDQ